jgi:uncharacterized protein
MRPFAALQPGQALLGCGHVHHQRLAPTPHQFTYGNYFLMLPMRALRSAAQASALVRNRWAAISFFDRDHGDGRSDALAWLEAQLQAHGVADADGEVWLQTYPRVLGYVFKPVSFWYCLRADGSLAAVVAEVNNTFGERHCYLLSGRELAWGRTVTANKVFHVSPFCRIEGSYRFRFTQTGERIVARVEHHTAQGPLLLTSLSGHLVPATSSTQRRVFWRYPLMTFGVIARIHWQALKLWAKRVPFVSKPAKPVLSTTPSITASQPSP